MKIQSMSLAGVHMRISCARMLRMLSAVCVVFLHLSSAGADTSADPATTVPPRPARRVRRRYDSVVQLHVPGTPQELLKTEKSPSDVKQSENFSSSTPLLKPSAPVVNIVPGHVVHIRQPSDRSKSQKSDGDLWITMPAGTLLGVNLVQSEPTLSVSWGWLAEDSQRIRREEGRKADARSEEEDNEDEELQAGDMFAMSERFIGGAIIPPAPNRAAGLADDASRKDVLALADRPAWSGVRLVPSPEQNRIEGLSPRDSWSPPSDHSPRGDHADMEPWFSGLGRRVTEIAEAHRPAPVTPAAPETQDWIVRRIDPAAVPSFESRSAREDAASLAGVPLLSGSHENYGRRGDIFSPSFQSTSSHLPGSMPSRSNWSEPTFGAPSMSSTVEPVRSTISEGSAFPSIREVIRPFDPAGRVWTDMNRPR